MSISFRVSSHAWDSVCKHLLRNDGREHLALMPAGIRRGADGLELLAFDAWAIADERLVGGAESWHLEPSPEALLEIVNRAIRTGVGLIEVHNHPFCKTAVEFSLADEHGFTEIVPYMLDSLHVPAYGALVMGAADNVDGVAWDGGLNRRSLIQRLEIVRPNRTVLTTTSGREASGKSHNPLSAASDRQVRAFGQAGQVAINDLRVSVVGLGGIGSLVVQQLAHLGVRQFVLVDPDVVEETNLNRLVGATAADSTNRAPKVAVAERLIRSLHKGAEVTTFATSVYNRNAMEAIAGTDLIIVGTDDQASRYAVNEISLAYMRPYLDLATEIFAPSGKIESIGGRMTFLTPGAGCLLCARAINQFEAAAELRPPAALQHDRERGYIRGSAEPAPSVLPLNAIIVSLAMNEVLAWITGWRQPHVQKLYDGMDGSVCDMLFNKDCACLPCSETLGRGDLANLATKYQPWQNGIDAAIRAA